MATFERFHRWMKADATHLTSVLARSVALLTLAQNRLALGALDQLQGKPVARLPTADGPASALSQTFTYGGSFKRPVSLDVFRAACERAGVDPAGAVFFERMKHERTHRSIAVAACQLKPTDVVRLSAVCTKGMDLFSVRCFFAVDDEKFVLASSTRPETVADLPAGAPLSYAAQFDSHVRIVCDDCVVFPARDIFNKIDNQRHCTAHVGAGAYVAPQPDDKYAGDARVHLVPGRFVFTSGIERVRI